VRLALEACSRAAPEGRDVGGKDSGGGSGGRGGGLLATLLEAGHSPHELRLAALLEELLVAGTATTATAVLSALVALRSDPELCRRAREEASRMLSPLEHGLADTAPADTESGSESGADRGAADERCPLLSACVREAMRLNPPAPLLFRVASADVKLRGAAGERVAAVRAGAAVVMSAAVLAMDRSAWDGAALFRPERWLVEGSSSASALYSEMSFGNGPRSCIGSGFAMTVAPILLAHALRDGNDAAEAG
jgi:cytochrome P450